MPSQSAIELTMDVVTRLEGWLAHLVGLGALKFDLMIGTKGFDDPIEVLTRPWHQLPKPVDVYPIVAFVEAVIGVVKLLLLDLRV